MATDRRFLPAFLSNDADFRTWGSGLAAQIQAMGLVQTADTGQVNWATVLRPAANAFTGYEIYRFADALQATKPVFLKVEYGVGSAVDRPALRISVGTGSNGAGGLTGQLGVVPATPGTGFSKVAGTTLESVCSGSTSRLSLVTNLDPGNNAFATVYLIERPRDPAGAPTGDGIFYFHGTSAATDFQVIPFTVAVPAAVATLPWAAPPSWTADGVNVALLPVPLVAAAKVFFASWLVYRTADIGALTSFTCTHQGAARTFMPIGSGALATQAIATLWE